MVARAAQIAGGTATPLIADADTGYGGIVNVRHTVKGYERAGCPRTSLAYRSYVRHRPREPGGIRPDANGRPYAST